MSLVDSTVRRKECRVVSVEDFRTARKRLKRSAQRGEKTNPTQ